MRQLIWKEYREKRWWFVPLAAYPIFCVGTNHSYIFLGLEDTSPAFGVLISFLIALLMGLSAYAPELGGDTADFLYAKPAGWKKILGAKLVVGLALIASSAILAAIVFRIACPAAYLPFAGIGPLAAGAGLAALFMSAGFLLGMCCSVALPGMLGSVITLASVIAILAAVETLVQTFAKDVAWAYSPWFPAALGAGVLAAGLAVMRFGLTLSLDARVAKYALVFAAVFVLGSVAVLGLAQPSRISAATFAYTFWSFSPSGEYASSSAVYAKSAPGQRSVRIYRLSDGATAELRLRGFQYWASGWTASDKVYALYHNDEGTRPSPVVLRLLWLDRNSKLQTREIRFPPALNANLSVSPSGRKALVHWSNWRPGMAASKSREMSHYRLVDLDRFRVVDVSFPPETGPLNWVSDSELAYHPEGQKTPTCLRVGP